MFFPRKVSRGYFADSARLLRCRASWEVTAPAEVQTKKFYSPPPATGESLLWFGSEPAACHHTTAEQLRAPHLHGSRNSDNLDYMSRFDNRLRRASPEHPRAPKAHLLILSPIVYRGRQRLVRSGSNAAPSRLWQGPRR